MNSDCGLRVLQRCEVSKVWPLPVMIHSPIQQHYGICLRIHEGFEVHWAAEDEATFQEIKCKLVRRYNLSSKGLSLLAISLVITL